MPEHQFFSCNNACNWPLLLFAACLFHPHSSRPALNESVPLMNAELGGTELSQCGGGWVETTERRWSLKVRFERDAAEQAVSLCYTAGSVTTDSSPTFCTFHHSHCSPQMLVSAFSASLSVFTSFYITPYCPSLLLTLVKKFSHSSAWHCFFIHNKAWSWNT